MKELLTPSRTFAVALLLGWGGCAAAQSLGTPVAEVLLGQPLAMSVPARFASRDTADECVHADVFYGEKRVPDGHVRATVTGPDGQRRVRIESESPIDEPIVTVSLRAGCQNTITRNYTLLPEYPSETRLAALEARNLAAAGAMAPLRLATRTAPAAAPAPAPVVRRAPARPTVVAQDSEAQPQRPVRGTRSSARRTAPAAHARLRLEPIDLEPQAMLRVTSTLAEPQGDAARRATAALLWQAINADPQELLRTSAMLEKLEADLAQMRKTGGAKALEDRSIGYDVSGLPKRIFVYHGANDKAAPFGQAKAFSDSLASSEYKVTFQPVDGATDDLAWNYHRKIIQNLTEAVLAGDAKPAAPAE
jgi:hypothetical protein